MKSWRWPPWKINLKLQWYENTQLISPAPWTSPSPPAKKIWETRSELHKTPLIHMFLAGSGKGGGFSTRVSTLESDLRPFQDPNAAKAPERSQQDSSERKVGKPRSGWLPVWSCRSGLPELEEFLLWNVLFLLDIISKNHKNHWNLFELLKNNLPAVYLKFGRKPNTWDLGAHSCLWWCHWTTWRYLKIS